LRLAQVKSKKERDNKGDLFGGGGTTLLDATEKGREKHAETVQEDQEASYL